MRTASQKPARPAIASAVGLAALLGLAAMVPGARAQTAPKFKVLAFFTEQNDLGHVSYQHEANRWFPTIAKKYGFSYDSTNTWNDCNTAKLSQYQLVIFLDNRPESATQRDAFKAYMDNGGAWIGCHFAAFALNNSAVIQNWDWYHNTFLGAGEYVSNTWRPTSAVLRVEDTTYAATKHLPTTFKSSPNEWYRWTKDLRTNKDIKILLSIDSTSYPLGTGPNPSEIWHSGYYPVVWTNKNYRMLYLNMGHNDIDYESGSNKELSFTFANDTQNQMMIDAVLAFGGINTTGILPPSDKSYPDAKSLLRSNGSRLSIIVPGPDGSASALDFLGRTIFNSTGN